MVRGLKNKSLSEKYGDNVMTGCILYCLTAKNRQISHGNLPAFFVQKKGLEPSRYCYHTDLNRARLPIPPLLLFQLSKLTN